MFQRKHTILRNFPLIGHFRYILELIRPEINQYFIESNQDGRPFSREQRSVVYQRAKKELDTLPFGTQKEVYSIGYECFKHSMYPIPLEEVEIQPAIIGKDRCENPYSCSILNISAMSFGSLGNTSILSLNKGAKLGGFYHNTGEGGISKYHLKYGGDLVWQIGTGYFGCRDHNGDFCMESFEEKALLDSVKMIEIKLSQGAKPGHGGILPGKKVTPELAEIRQVKVGEDVISPPYHKAFKNPSELLDFVELLRKTCKKPIGIKFCLGKYREFWELALLMSQKKKYVDFITVDGGEGGTGAAPLELSNHIGMPLYDSLIFVHNVLKGLEIRDEIKIGASGKILTGFGVLKCLSLGADFCNSARGMMMALGCIQAIRCNSNHCPAGIATQDPQLTVGIDVNYKSKRVANFYSETMKSMRDLLGSMGLKNQKEITPHLLMRRTSLQHFESYAQLYTFLNNGELLNSSVDVYPYCQLLKEEII